MPAGFLGTRADLFMDVVITVVALVPLLLVAAFLLARARRYQAHKMLQTTLTATLAVVLVAFEVYLRTHGGIDGFSRGSRFHGTAFLAGFLGLHLCFALSSAVLWGVLFSLSWQRMPRPARPGAWSAEHRRWGRVVMLDMGLTALTGLGLYALCFVY